MALRIKTENHRNGPLRYWRAMCDLTREKGSFTLADIFGLQNGRSTGVVKAYVLHCRSIGAIEVAARERNEKNRTRHRYRVLNLAAKAPVVRRACYTGERGKVFQNLWNAMRQLRQFTVRELTYAATTEDVTVKEKTARTYVDALAKAGIVAKIARANPRVGAYATWRLMPMGNTGPHAPALTSEGIFDVNLQRLVNVTAQQNVQHDGRAA